MLENQRILGCEHACWKLEDLGLESRRTAITDHRRYDGIESKLKTLNLVLGNTCNLTCSYCCKEFSHSWLADVVNYGGYDIEDRDNRYRPTAMDHVMMRVSQTGQQKTKMWELILGQLRQDINNLEEVLITGGEPFLYNNLVDIVDMFRDQKITIVTGLGIKKQRLISMLEKLSNKNITIAVSGENTNSFYEFNRYGQSYQDFLDNLDLIKEKFSLRYHCVISNLTLFDFENYADNIVGNSPILITPVTDPDFMSPWVVDEISRQRSIDRFLKSKNKHVNGLIDLLKNQPTERERSQMAGWMRRFAATRNLDLAIFPASFLRWLQL